MKKKIIKFYSINNVSVNTTFCFAKRAIKQKKQLHQAINSKTLVQLKTKKNWSNQLQVYKFYMLKLKQKQWLSGKNRLKFFFLNSYFIDDLILQTFNRAQSIRLKQFQIWYTFKKYFNKNLNIKIKSFPKLGMLSSHFVHFISKKNVSYQTRSKYKAKMANLNAIYLYIYTYAIFLYNYTNLINNKIFFFAGNLSKQHKWVDDEFCTNISNWSTSKALTEPINIYDYQLIDYSNIVEQSALIRQYLFESDTIKKENLFLLIKSVLNESQLNLLSLSQKNLNNSCTLTCGDLSQNILYFDYFYKNI